MTPAARIKASIELLGHIAGSPVPMDATVGDYMRARRYIGARDRADIAERVYDIMRARARPRAHEQAEAGGHHLGPGKGAGAAASPRPSAVSARLATVSGAPGVG